MKLSVSILSIKENLKENIKKLCALKIDYLHLDIMDGKFVPNKTWTINELKPILPMSSKRFDVHLMVNDLDKYINEYISINPFYITFHIEASCDIKKYINLVKKNNINVGISIKPDTNIDKIIPYLKYVDLVLVMSVNPGFGGQKFIEETSSRIDYLYEYRKENNLKYKIEVDGGVNNVTINKCNKADIVVVGSYITCNDYEESIKNLNLN